MSRVIILPGNCVTDVERENWYKWLQLKLLSWNVFRRGVVLKNMPDPFMARMKFWLPFIHNELKCDEDTILIGHSSGAVAAMRYLETHKAHGLVLVSANHTDLGIPNEQISGYYDKPWQWDKIRKNCKWVIQIGSDNDPFIPTHEMRHVGQKLSADYFEYPNRGHFVSKEFPEILELIKEKTGFYAAPMSYMLFY